MRNVLMLLFLFGAVIVCQAQENNKLSSFQLAAIQKLLDDFRIPGSPGGSIGIIQDGQFIYRESVGLANLDYGILNTDTTVFYIGSMSKQFVAAALLLLEERDKIDLDATIQTYLPDFPSYDWPVTLRQAIHHTAGLKDSNTLQLFQGVNLQFEEVFDNDDLYSLICHQTQLDFKPGTRYSYSSSGYIVLTRVIEQVCGQSLANFLQQQVFGPLGMQRTFLSDNHNQVVPNRAVSYWYTGEAQWERRSLVFNAYGDGGIMTTVSDLLLWDQAFYDDRLGIPNFSEKMYSLGTLSNGTTIPYARALNVWEYLGRRIIQHNGGMLGYRADLARFPSEGLSIVALGNDHRFNSTGLILQIASILLPDRSEAPANLNQEPWPALDTILAQQKVGRYFIEELNLWNRISFQNDSLFYDFGSDYRSPLQPTEDPTTFYLSERDEWVTFREDTLIRRGPYGSRKGVRFDYTPPTDLSQLAAFTGHYHSPELSTDYRFYIETNRFYLKIKGRKPIILFPDPVDPRVNWNGHERVWIGFGMISFRRENGTVTGFKIGNNRVSGVEFHKIKTH